MPWRPETLKHLRERRGLTQQQLADAVGVHRVHLARLETGVYEPGISLAEKLATALKVKITDLLK